MKIKKCKSCGKKLGIIGVLGKFCSFKCRIEFERKKLIQ
jgi:hypothetical protein